MPTVLRPDLPPEIDDVFRRVLSKQPGDRYQSCREFIDAARVALGIFGPGTQSSLAYGAVTGGPRTGAPAGRQAGPAPDRYSWGSVASQPHAARPLDPVAPGSVGAGSSALAGQLWGAPPGAGHPGGPSPPPPGRSAPRGRAGPARPAARPRPPAAPGAPRWTAGSRRA